jgi:Phosphoesterase family
MAMMNRVIFQNCYLPFLALLVLLTVAGLLTVGCRFAGPDGRVAASAADPLQKINYVIVIYQENHSFDNYFGIFPGADGIANADATANQVDKQGRPYVTLPQPLANPKEGRRAPGPTLPG